MPMSLGHELKAFAKIITDWKVKKKKEVCFVINLSGHREHHVQKTRAQ
jgi:hypothetical protein